MSVLFDSGDDEIGFLSQEFLAETLLCSQFWEVDNIVPANESDSNGDGTLEDEDPSPASETRSKLSPGGGIGLGRAEMTP